MKMQAFIPATLLTKRLRHRCFPVNFAYFLRKPILKNICKRLFQRFPTGTSNITSNIASEEDIFSITKQKNHSQTPLDKKSSPFHDALDDFVFLHFTNACQTAFTLIKDDSTEEL